MIKKPNLLGCISFLLITYFCSCNNTASTSGFIGIYTIDKMDPFDSNRISTVQTASDWKIILADSNNFQLYGTNKNIVGYWTAENKGQEYQILFQGGGVTTTARFNGKEIYFDKPDKLLDSLFLKATFIKKE